tara:strand:+ start:186 stop:482 length:297 start_codon:yes stop_codon:yes gene_type:complete
MLSNISWKKTERSHEPEPKVEIDFDSMKTRQLQRESSRALASGAIVATSDNLYKYNKSAPHNSNLWYIAVVKDYVAKYGNLPSKAGPGKDIKLIIEDE